MATECDAQGGNKLRSAVSGKKLLYAIDYSYVGRSLHIICIFIKVTKHVGVDVEWADSILRQDTSSSQT